MTCSGGTGPTQQIGVGDLLPSLVVDVQTCTGGFDFTGWTLTLELRGPVQVTGAAAGTSEGVVTYDWVAGNTDFPGDYSVRIRGMSPTGRPRTFPVAGVVRIVG